MLQFHSMSKLVLITAFTTLGGVLSVLAASGFMVLREAVRIRVLPHMISFATGALLGASLLALLPHAIEYSGTHTHELGASLVGGILLFFVLEKLVLWRHSHDHAHDCGEHSPLLHTRAESSAYLVLIGDSLHNFVDGLVIGAAFLANERLGIASAIAVIAHEIPQEVGDFAIFLRGGFSRAKALSLNLLSSLASVAGGWVAYFALGGSQAFLPYALALAVSSLLYVAMSDLIPGLHERTDARTALSQVAFIAAGIALIAFTHHHSA
jgi:zinc and cadmium transporter